MSAVTDRGKSPDEIEREVEEARANLRSTLGDIRASLSPGQMLDQAIDYARGSGGGDFVRNLGRQVRDNPLPIALMGVGIGWLMTGGGQTGRRPGGVGWVDPDRHHVHVDGPLVGPDRSHGLGPDRAHGNGLADRAGSLAAGAGDAAGRLADGAKSAAGGIAGAARSVTEGVRHGAAATADRAGALADDATRLAHDGRERVGAATGAAYDSLRRRGHDAEAGLARIADEQPLLIGLAGLAVGALVGALLPVTRSEDRAFGEAADRVKDEAARLARAGYEAAEEVVAEVADDAGAALADRGLDAGAAKDAVADLASSVRSHTAEAVSGAPKSAPATERPAGAGTGSDPRRETVPAQSAAARPATPAGSVP